MNSGLRNEKPINSVWSRFIINSLSVGVRSVFSPVNCLSKLLTSLRCFYNINIILFFYGFLMPCVSDTHDFWFKWRLHFAVFNFCPIDTSKKYMSPNVFLAPGTSSQSFHRIFSQKLKFSKNINILKQKQKMFLLDIQYIRKAIF